MNRIIGAIVFAGMAAGCSGGDGDGAAGLCERVCMAMQAADCDNSPPSQSECVDGCETVLTTACSAEYEALLACADGEPVSCTADGIPVVSSCSVEQTEFDECFNN